MEFGMKYVTLMDEISTGLDSAATFDIINTQCSIAKTLRKTVVIALLQPAPEVFALFDDVMILNDGEVMYHGPREQVVEYFESLGFVCPPGRDVADFLLDLGTKEQRVYEVDVGDKMRNQPRFPGEFAEVFRRSSIYGETLSALVAPYRPELLDNVVDHMNPTPEFHQTFWENTRELIKRESLVAIRNTPFLAGRAVMTLLMGLLYSTTFYQFDPTRIQVVIGVVFSAVLFLSLGQVSLIPTFMAARDIFYKQRSANFYRTSSYVLANSLSLIPLAAIESLVFGSLVYWMCGFVASAGSFLLFIALLLLTNMAFGAWFFFVSAVSPNMNVANPLAMVSILFFVLFAGFVVLKSKIPDYFIWLYWLSPISWSVRAIAVNEYRSSKLDVCEYGGVDYCKQFDGKTMGRYYLSIFDIPSEKEWVIYSLIYLALIYVLFMCFSYYVLEYKRFESPENVSITNKNEDENRDEAASELYVLATTPKRSSSPTTPGSSSHVGGDVTLTVAAHEKNFVPVVVAFQDLWYSVPVPGNSKETIDLLKGITGYA
ncbi:Atp-binding protein, partial [Globisporangium polare]